MSSSSGSAKSPGSNTWINVTVFSTMALAIVVFLLSLPSGHDKNTSASAPSFQPVGRATTSNATSLAGTTAGPANAGCTQATVPVSVPYPGDNDARSDWVYNEGGCKADPTPGVGSGLYRVWCKDMDWKVHEWTDQDCWHYRGLQFQRTGVPDNDNTSLNIDVKFRNAT